MDLFLLVLVLPVAIACVRGECLGAPGFMTWNMEAGVELGLSGLGAVQKPTAVPAEVWLFKNAPKSLKAPFGTSGWELSRRVPAEGAAAPRIPGCGIWE